MPRIIDQLQNALQTSNYRCAKDGTVVRCRKLKHSDNKVDEEFWWNEEEVYINSDRYWTQKRIRTHKQLLIDASGMASLQTRLESLQQKRLTVINYDSVLFGDLTLCIDIRPLEQSKGMYRMQIYTCNVSRS